MSDPEKYERRDINVSALTSFIVLMIGGLLLSLLVGYGLHRGYIAFQKRGFAKMSPMADMHRIPPEPRLQTDPSGDLVKMKAAEDIQLTQYGWVDTQNEVVRLPIERAKKLIAERGLPSRNTP